MVSPLKSVRAGVKCTLIHRHNISVYTAHPPGLRGDLVFVSSALGSTSIRTAGSSVSIFTSGFTSTSPLALPLPNVGGNGGGGGKSPLGRSLRMGRGGGGGRRPAPTSILTLPSAMKGGRGGGGKSLVTGAAGSERQGGMGGGGSSSGSWVGWMK